MSNCHESVTQGWFNISVMSTAYQSSLKNLEKLEPEFIIRNSGLENAYQELTNAVRTHVYSKYVPTEDNPGTKAEALESLIFKKLGKIRDIENKLCAEFTTEQDLKKLNADDREAVYNLIADYFYEKNPLALAVVNYARQTVKAAPTPSPGLTQYDEAFVEALDAKIPKGVSAPQRMQIIQSTQQSLDKSTPKDDRLGLKFDLDRSYILRKDMKDIVGKSCEEYGSRIAFDLLAESTQQKDIQTYKSLFSAHDTWQSNVKTTTKNTQPQKIENKQEDARQSSSEESHRWRNKISNRRVVEGLVGTALLVAPSFIPEPEPEDAKNKNKLTFGKVLRTTAAVVSTIAGIYLLSSALSGSSQRSR